MGSGITAGAVLGWPADFHALAGHLICHPRRANDNRKITQLCVCPPPHPAGSCSLQLAPSAQCRHPFEYLCVGVQSWFVWPLDWLARPLVRPACISASGFCIWHHAQRRRGTEREI